MTIFARIMTLPWLMLCLQLFFLSYNHNFVEGWGNRQYWCQKHPEVCGSHWPILPDGNTTYTKKDTNHGVSEEGLRDVSKYLQPDTIGRDPYYDNLNHNNATLCTRNCTAYPDARICYYLFIIELHHALGPACQNCSSGTTDNCFETHCVPATGIERQVISINRMIPGPAIDVCRGDRIVVDVYNKMPSESITIHWHGVLQQGTPWMDGVPFITQCPITPNNKFRYNFKALTNGTLFYHSHTGMSHVDGVVGSLTVRIPHREDPNSVFHDWDLPSHNILIQDWYNLPFSIYSPGYYKNQLQAGIKPSTYLINGIGKDKDSDNETKVPFAEFHVEHGYKYRFRVVGGTTATCAIKFTVQNHPLSVVALDGFPCAPFSVDTLVMSGGQRTDVVIEANQTQGGTHWILVQGMNGCRGISQRAYLVYNNSLSRPANSSDFETLLQNKKLRYLNNFELDCLDPNNTCTDTLRQPPDAPTPTAIQKLINQQPNITIEFQAGNKRFSQEELTSGYQSYHLPAGQALGAFVNTLNNVSGVLPPAPPITQYNDIPADLICSDCEKRNISYRSCLCILDIPLNSVVDVVFEDRFPKGVASPNRTLHPFHIHGHHFTVIPIEFALIPRAPSAPPIPEGFIQRDTVFIPIDGYTKVRFLADNPGYWIMHCHYSMHMEGGMFVVFKVGSDEEIPKPPNNSFPKCGHYIPSI